MKFKYIEDIATADVAFEAYGKNLEETFSNAALAMFEVETDTKRVEPKEKKEVKVEGQDLQALLFDWLSELILLRDVEKMFFSRFDVEIGKTGGKYGLTADVFGEKIDREKHEMKIEVKAVSYQLMEVVEKPDECKVRVILDI